jgi:hypothetical protein
LVTVQGEKRHRQKGCQNKGYGDSDSFVPHGPVTTLI